jgi:hypothetical protein
MRQPMMPLIKRRRPMTDSDTQFYFNAPAQKLGLGATQMIYRNFGSGAGAKLLAHEEKPREVAQAALAFFKSP